MQNPPRLSRPDLDYDDCISQPEEIQDFQKPAALEDSKTRPARPSKMRRLICLVIGYMCHLFLYDSQHGQRLLSIGFNAQSCEEQQLGRELQAPLQDGNI